MRIVQIGSMDLIGQRFNGQYLTQAFNRQGIDCHHLVWEKQGNDPHTSLLFGFPKRRGMARIAEKIEDALSIRALIQFWTPLLFFNKHFKKANVVHFHLIQWPSFFSILVLPLVCLLKKKVVWTIHDFWPITGHCVYPFDCEKYKTGCGKCPYPKTNFRIRRDTTAFMWRLKKFLYSISPFEVIVASEFMRERVSQSPLVKGKKIHLIPFGLELDKFCPPKRNSKPDFGIPQDAVVIAFRSAVGDFKGLEYIQEAFRKVKSNRKICLLTFNTPGQMKEFEKRMQVVDLGWTNNEAMTISAYQTADFFLMPSTQEAFGMMAMEAMACGKPVVVFSGTSLPEVIGENQGGIVVPKGSADELAAAIVKLVEDDEARMRLGASARRFAEEKYQASRHLQDILNVYQEGLN